MSVVYTIKFNLKFMLSF